MFSYRHAFHAGSHADILKHLVMIHLVEYLQEKPGALTIVDTHAGAGSYNLKEGVATLKNEHRSGIERLWNKPGLPAILANYVELVSRP